jgi:hypothetical protein
MRYSRRSLPLGYYFFLDKKVAKNQDGKNLLPARPVPGPVFRQAFALFGIVLHVPFCFKLKQFLLNKVIKLA